MDQTCIICNYQTYDYSNWRKHLETKKHKHNMIKNDQYANQLSDDESITDRKYPTKIPSIKKKCNKEDNNAKKVSVSTTSNIIAKNDDLYEKSNTCPTNVKSRVSTKINKNREKMEIHEKKNITGVLKVAAPTKTTTNVVYCCPYCDETFAHSSGLSRHKNYRCKMKTNPEIVNEQPIIFTKKELEDHVLRATEKLRDQFEKEKLIQQINNQAELLNKLTEDNNFFKESQKASNATLNTSINVADKSMSALTFLTTHFKKTPVLNKLTHNGVKQLLKFNTHLSERLISYSNNNTLDHYIGDAIIAHIHTDNPEDQPVWNSDVARLTYIIRTLVGNKHVWERDPKGEKFIKFVIQPVLDYLKDYLTDCLTKLPHVPDTSCMAERDDMMEKCSGLTGALGTISGKKFARTIAAHVASHVVLKQTIE